MDGSLGTFSALDWGIVGGFLVLATLIGGPLAGRQTSLRDFFLGGRKLPWYAVCGSIIATEVSAVTLIIFPWIVFQPGGDVTYLQHGVFGMVLARAIIAWFLIPAYFEREIYSPYDYMGARLGPRVKSLVSGLFALGGVLAQSVRVLTTALVLDLLLRDELRPVEEALGVPSLALAIGAIGVVAVLWTFMGGIATVIWTDAILFLIFLLTPIVALVVIAGRVDGGLETILVAGRGAQKLRFFDFDPSLARPDTFWAAVLGTTVMGVAVFGTDQMMAQRLFCCRSVREARLAIVVSAASLVITVLVACVGIALFTYYERFPLEGEALALFEENGNRIFPIFIVSVIGTGVKGLIVAGIFAAAISSLDSIMAALSQTVLSAVYLPYRERVLRRRGVDPRAPEVEAAEGRRSVRVSRGLVAVSGVLLCATALLMQRASEDYRSILDLALAMAGYTGGALFAGFLLAFLPLRVDGSGYLWSAPLSVMTVLAVAWSEPWTHAACWAFAWIALGAWVALRVLPELRRPDGVPAGTLLAQTTALLVGLAVVVWLSRFGDLTVLGEVEGDAAWVTGRVTWPWLVPIGGTVAFVLGVLLARPGAGTRDVGDPASA